MPLEEEVKVGAYPFAGTTDKVEEVHQPTRNGFGSVTTNMHDIFTSPKWTLKAHEYRQIRLWLLQDLRHFL